jgi:hypothetical protein
MTEKTFLLWLNYKYLGALLPRLPPYWCKDCRMGALFRLNQDRMLDDDADTLSPLYKIYLPLNILLNKYHI